MILPFTLLSFLFGCARFHAPDTSPFDISGIPGIHSDVGAFSEKFEPGFQELLLQSAPDGYAQALFDLSEQVDLHELGRMLDSAGSSRSERRRIVVRALETVSSRQQASLKPTLDRLMEAGLIDFVRPVAIVNRLVVEGSPAGILQLAARPEIASVMPEWTSLHHGDDAGRTSTSGRAGAGDRFTSWALETIGATRLWEEGLDGEGIVVASIDSGVFAAHEQLAGRALDGDRAWYDPVGGTLSPYDSHVHGTMILSQAVGGNPNGRIIGVAPGARWATALGNYKNFYSRVRMTLSADWVLRVARPDVLINAWADRESRCAEFDLPFINAWKASGIFVVFAAGNAGPAPGSGEAPAHLQGTYPDGRAVFSVAAVTPGLEIYDKSSRGPSPCGSSGYPGIAAPGTELPHAYPGSPTNYATGEGTSLSAGLLGGAAALLLQADPELLPAELEDIMLASARDLPPAGKDLGSGAGLLDLPAALELIRKRHE